MDEPGRGRRPGPPRLFRRERSTRQSGSMVSQRRHCGGGTTVGGVLRRSPLRQVFRPSCPSTVALTCLIGVLIRWTGVVLVVSAGDLDDEIFTPRSFDGVGNNEAFLAWGAVGTTLLRSVADSDYADSAFNPPGELTRPTAREVMTDVFLASPPAVSTKSALFVAWGQLLTYDLALFRDNSSEPFDVPCNDGEAGVGIDVWCPLGANSDPIPFFRSQAALSDDEGAHRAETRSPVNHATAFVDLDFVYGRSEDEAAALRTADDTGFMNVTDRGLPFLNADGTWLIADQRTARFPVTFALHAVLLLEHNRCCVEIAPALRFEGGEDIYQACRGWTIAVFQHITENDFLIQLLGGNIQDLGEAADPLPSTPSSRRRRELHQNEQGAAPEEETADAQDDAGGSPTKSSGSSSESQRRQRGEEGEGAAPAPGERRRRKLWKLWDYDETVNPGADTFTLTAGAAAFESAIPPTVRVVGEGYEPTPFDNTELAMAVGGESLASFFEDVEIADVLRGAVLSPAFAVDTRYAMAISNGSPLFKLPVDAVQRGRDHGLPTYNEARLAFGLAMATSFSDVTAPMPASSTTTSTSMTTSLSTATATPTSTSSSDSRIDEEVAAVLSAAYGGNVSSLDAITGGLAESTGSSSGGCFGPLLHAAWQEQMYRTFQGDRFHHLHTRPIEDASLATVSDLLNRTTGAADLPLSTFVAAGVTVCGADCIGVGAAEAELSGSYSMVWQVLEGGLLSISLSAKGIGEAGMLGIGWGGLTMSDAQDYVICEVKSREEAECIDRKPTGARSLPDPDDEDSDLGFESVEIDGDWTTVTFLKSTAPLDGEDYDLATDMKEEIDTEVIFAYREGAGVGQHPNANRGASTVNFATGQVDNLCLEDKFVSLHGALMLIAWMVLAPWGIYFVRYRKGEEVDVIWRYQWWEMHEEIMIVASEAVLPLGITAIFASSGDHNSSHAHWGYYMIAAVIAQVLSGWLRVKGLKGENANFSLFHRFNKFFHIYAGYFAYLAGVAQCYRGLELVASNDQLIFSAGDGLDLQLGSFGFVYRHGFPAWFGLITLTFLCLETRKQYRRYFNKGSANVLGCVQIINERHQGGDGSKGVGGDNAGGDAGGSARDTERLMPRTEDLPIYTLAEVNDKVLNGQSWVLVDGAILDVADFAQRHPGGRRLILNALGTDVTQELLGEDLSVGHAMSFNPHVHTGRAWMILRELVIGYVEEDDDEDEEDDQDTGDDTRNGSGSGEETNEERGQSAASEGGSSAAEKPKINKFRIAGQAVKLVAARGALSSDALAAKAQRLNSLASIPDEVAEPPETGGPAPGFSEMAAVTENAGPRQRASPRRSNSSKKRLLERFHVCPLLFRERMGTAGTGVGRKGDARDSRPVYRYIFLCPGQAQALAEAITGVCYFNMRAKEKGHGVIQRSYNAYAVRVQNLESSPTPGGGMGGLSYGGDKGAGMLRVVPASQTSEGILCIEMRIRLYNDGTMSQLLERLAKDTDNPAVQLQGPFVIQKLVPPPAHRNVVMIAAGTGINPMVQQIRDLALPRGKAQSSRSRLALVWQVTSEADLYVADEIGSMQAKSNGLLEVTVLISGEYRKRNIPGAAFRKGAGKLLANARGLVSPVPSSPAESVRAAVSSLRRRPKSSPCAAISESQPGPISDPFLSENSSTAEEEKDGAGSTKRPSPDAAGGRGGGTNIKSIFPSTSHHKRAAAAAIAGALTRGKLCREKLDEVFGPNLLAIVEATLKEDGLSATARQRARSKSHSSADHAPDAGDSKERDGDDDQKLKQLTGSGSAPGKLQVVVSGPRGFVVFVETLLKEMDIPSGAIVLLD